jgi:hypothetical protein
VWYLGREGLLENDVKLAKTVVVHTDEKLKEGRREGRKGANRSGNVEREGGRSGGKCLHNTPPTCSMG